MDNLDRLTQRQRIQYGLIIEVLESRKEMLDRERKKEPESYDDGNFDCTNYLEAAKSDPVNFMEHLYQFAVVDCFDDKNAIEDAVTAEEVYMAAADDELKAEIRMEAVAAELTYAKDELAIATAIAETRQESSDAAHKRMMDSVWKCE